jgi:RNA polymerase sigma factor (sigma-70 family)
MATGASLEALQPVVRSMARRLAYNSHGALQADDLVQVGMLAAHTVLLRSGSLEEDRIRARAGTAARNAMVDLARVETRSRASPAVQRAHAAQPLGGQDGQAMHVADAAPGPEEIAIKRQMARLVVEAIDGLPRRLQDVLRLSYEGDKTRDDIARLWGVDPSRISQLHAEAIAELRKVLAPDEAPLHGQSTAREMFAPDIVCGVTPRLLVG